MGIGYYPYGKELRAYHNGEQEKYLTTGHERDTETGLDYRGARFYDSDVARFLSLDPLAMTFPGQSAYSYSLDNPVIYTDPDGKFPKIFTKSNGNIGTIKEQWQYNKAIVSGFASAMGSSIEGLAKMGSLGGQMEIMGDLAAFGGMLANDFEGTISAIGDQALQFVGDLQSDDAKTRGKAEGALYAIVVETVAGSKGAGGLTKVATKLDNLPTPQKKIAGGQKTGKYSKKKAREDAKAKRDQQPASEDYAKYKAKELEKTKGKDAKRQAHDKKEAGAPDRTKEQLDKDYDINN